MRNHAGITKNDLSGIAAPGFAACVTTALRFVVTQARRFRTTYQPSEHLARVGAVRRPRASNRFRVMDNPLHSLRKSPVQCLRGRLPRSIEQRHDLAALGSLVLPVFSGQLVVINGLGPT